MNSQRKRIIVSVLSSVAAHLFLVLLAIIMIGIGGFLPPEPAVASPPNEVVIYLPELIPESPAEAERRVQPRYVRTTESNRAAAPPAVAAFESDRNTLAASDGSVSGAEPLPSQDGMKNLPFVELEDREHVDGEKANEAASAAIPRMATAPPVPLTPTPQTVASIAMATPSLPSPLIPKPEVAPRSRDQDGKVAPAPRASDLRKKSFSDRLDVIDVPVMPLEKERIEGDETPMKKVEEAPHERTSEDVAEAETMPRVLPAEPISSVQPAPGSPGFRPHTRATEIRGTISNRGRASLDAAETPLGRYKARVNHEIEKLWHRYRQQKAEFIVYGSIQLKFQVDRYGKPRNLKVIRNDANAIMADFTLSAILEADIPPMPEEILDILQDETLDVTYDVIIY